MSFTIKQIATEPNESELIGGYQSIIEQFHVKGEPLAPMLNASTSFQIVLSPPEYPGFETIPVKTTGIGGLIRILVQLWNDLSYEGDMVELDIEPASEANAYRVMFFEQDGEQGDHWLDSFMNSLSEVQDSCDWGAFEWSLKGALYQIHKARVLDLS